MGSFTPGAECHFSPHSISHAPQEMAPISTAAFPAGCATGSEPIVLPSSSLHLGTKSLGRFTGIVLYLQIPDGRSTSVRLKQLPLKFRYLQWLQERGSNTAECSEICVFTGG